MWNEAKHHAETLLGNLLMEREALEYIRSHSTEYIAEADPYFKLIDQYAKMSELVLPIVESTIKLTPVTRFVYKLLFIGFLVAFNFKDKFFGYKFFKHYSDLVIRLFRTFMDELNAEICVKYVKKLQRGLAPWVRRVKEKAILQNIILNSFFEDTESMQGGSR